MPQYLQLPCFSIQIQVPYHYLQNKIEAIPNYAQ